jgi:hypothetical protein
VSFALADVGAGVGVIKGGWGFVISAYSLSAVIISVYAASVLARYRAEAARRARRPANP